MHAHTTKTRRHEEIWLRAFVPSWLNGRELVSGGQIFFRTAKFL